MKVLNRRDFGGKVPPGAVYVGRPTKWGNPYKVGNPAPYPFHGIIDHTLAVELYRQYLKYHPKIVEAARKELRGKDLACWCSPRPCHAEVLLEIANE